MSWLRYFRRSKADRELQEEMEAYMAEETAENIARGMDADEARRRARVKLGNPQSVRETLWRQNTLSLLDGVGRDLKYAARTLKRTPGFAITVVLTLAIGIGANTAIFSVLNSVLLRPLPYPHSDELAAMWMNAPGAAGLSNVNSGLQLSPSMYLTFARHNQSFQSMGVWQMRSANVTGIAQPDQVNAAFLSDGVLETLQVPAMLGRWFTLADQDPRGAKTVMLSYGYWQRRFGGDHGVIGRSLQVDGQTRTIAGVMPKGFRVVDQEFEVLIPLAFDPANQKMGGFGYTGIARLKPGMTLAQADADASRLISMWMDSWTNGPGTNPHYYEVWRITPNFRPLKQQVIGNIGNVLWVVMATVGLVMLIACVNVANLLMVRAEMRHQELSIRAALGAGRARLVRDLLIESLLLGLTGGAVSIFVAYAGLKLLAALGPTDLPRLSEVSFDAGSLGFTFALAVFSGLLFGLMTAWKYAGTKSSAMIPGANRTASIGRTRQRSRSVLVVAQVAMALVLLISSALMIRTFVALRHVEPGFADAAHVETMSIFIPEQMEMDPHMVAVTQRAITEKLATIPGVTSVGFAAAMPMDGNDPNWDSIAVEGKAYTGGDGALQLYNYISPGYFQTLGTRLMAGRDFTWDDLEQVRPLVVVSQSFARENWGSEQAAIGKRVRKYESSPWQEVIGVVEDVHVHGVDEKAPGIVYWPAIFYARFATPPEMDGLRFTSFAIHSSRAGTEGLLAEMQRAVWSVNANLPLAGVGTMQEIYSSSMARTSFTLVMLVIAGVMALALGILGIYSVISYAVSQRRREIGIRMALGAKKSELVWVFVRSALILTGVGTVIGLGSAAVLMRLMQTLLFGISPLDPITFTTVPVVLVAAAALASYLPARRTAAVNPVEALRAE